MSSVIDELQSDALDPKVNVSDLLRKAYLIAKKLGLTDFEKWIRNELNGYAKIGPYPEYRKLQGYVGVYSPFHGWQPVTFQDATEAEVLSSRSNAQSISEIEALISVDEQKGPISLPYPHEIGIRLMNTIGSPTPPVLLIDKAELERILNAVRNALLDWALKLSEENIQASGISFTPQDKIKASEFGYTVNNFFGPVTHS